MKHFYLLFLILTVFLSCSLVNPKVIPDKNLAAAVRKELDLAPNAPISEKDLRTLERLIAMHRGMKDLTGLEKVKSLQILSVGFNGITNITPLTCLTQLKGLGLRSNRIRDIAPLTKLTELNSLLTHLHLRENKIRDISVIENFKNLHLLGIKGNPIQDMTPIDRLRKQVPTFHLGTEIDP